MSLIHSFLSDLGTDNSSAIPDSSFKAKSWLCYSIPSLGMVASNELCYAAWCGQGPSTWLEINIGSKQMLVRMATRGPQQGNPVSSFYVEYSHDAATWLNYTEGGVRRVSGIYWRRGGTIFAWELKRVRNIRLQESYKFTSSLTMRQRKVSMIQ